MQTVSENLKKQWSLVETTLEKWLEERKELLVLYCNYGDSGNNPDPSGIYPRWTDVRRFCQILVDYVSAGHFEVYDQLIREAEAANDDSVLLVEELYPKLHQSTQFALDFNDKYATEESWENTHEDFQEDLSRLGEELSTRFEMEDRLIEEMHSSHSPLVVQQEPERQKSIA
jgi:regulator of sigma D